MFAKINIKWYNNPKKNSWGVFYGSSRQIEGIG